MMKKIRQSVAPTWDSCCCWWPWLAPCCALEEPGLGEKNLDVLRIDGTLNSENAEAWDFGIPYVSEKAPHLYQQIDPGDFQHWDNRSGAAVVGFRGAHLAQWRVP